MITSDLYLIVYYMELSCAGLVGVLCVIYSMQYGYTWVTDGEFGPNMLIQSTMLGVLGYTMAPKDSHWVYVAPDGASGSDGTLGLVILLIISIMIPPLITFYVITLSVLFAFGLLHFIRFCIRINNHVSFIRHTSTSIPKPDGD